jgi:hypothetical protein
MRETQGDKGDKRDKEDKGSRRNFSPSSLGDAVPHSQSAVIVITTVENDYSVELARI